MRTGNNYTEQLYRFICPHSHWTRVFCVLNQGRFRTRSSVRPTHSCGSIFSRDQTCFLCSNLGSNLVFTGTRALRWDYSHYLILELSEKSALGGLSHKIGYHITGWAPLHSHLLLVYPVCYKKVADIDMLCALAARSLAVLLKKDGTLVVLIDNVFGNLVALTFQEIFRPA